MFTYRNANISRWILFITVIILLQMSQIQAQPLSEKMQEKTLSHIIKPLPSDDLDSIIQTQAERRILAPSVYTYNYTEDFQAYILSYNKNFTLSSINETLFDVQIPGFSQPDDFNFSILRLVDNQSVEIDVNFSRTISRSFLTIAFYHNNSFDEPEDSDPLFTTISVYIPIKLGEAASMVNQALQTGIDIVFGVTLFSLVVCFFTKERTLVLWSLIDYMQMVYVLFYVGTQFPWEFRSVIIGFSIATFNFFPNPFQNLDYPINDTVSYIVDPQALSFVFCFWPWFILLLIIGTLQIIIYIIFQTTKNHPKSHIQVLPFKYLIHWSGLLRLYSTCFLALIFSILVQFANLTTDPVSIAGAVLGGLTLIAFFCLFLISVKLLRADKSRLRHDVDYRTRFIVLYETVKLRKTSSKYWNIIGMLRKFVLVVIIVALKQVPVAQAVCILVQNLIYFFYFIFALPYFKTKFNLITALREGLLIPVHCIVLVFVIDDSTGFLNGKRDQVGWVGVCFNAIIFCVHFIVFTTDSLLSIKKKAKLPTEEDDPTPEESKIAQKPKVKEYEPNPLNNLSNDQLFLDDLSGRKSPQKLVSPRPNRKIKTVIFHNNPNLEASVNKDESNEEIGGRSRADSFIQIDNNLGSYRSRQSPTRNGLDTYNTGSNALIQWRQNPHLIENNNDETRALDESSRQLSLVKKPKDSSITSIQEY